MQHHDDSSITIIHKSCRNFDLWDGYAANRYRLIRHLTSNNIHNNIVLAGDSHSSWVSDLSFRKLGIHRKDGDGDAVSGSDSDSDDDQFMSSFAYDQQTGAGAGGAEFAVPAISSETPTGPNVPSFIARLISAWLVRQNPELQWQDLAWNGYVELSVSTEKVEASYWGVAVREPTRTEKLLGRFEVLSGQDRLRRNPDVGGGTVATGAVKDGG